MSVILNQLGNLLVKAHCRGLNQVISLGFHRHPILCNNSIVASAIGDTTIVSKVNTDDVRKEIFRNVNKLIQDENEGRLFAIVHLCGKQFKVTPGDIILVEGYWPPSTGDQIKLEKVLIAGGQDFSLIGRPILQKGLVDVQATIIEKSLTHTKTHFKKKRRKQYIRFNFQRSPNTMIRINSIEIAEKVNQIHTQYDPKLIFSH